MRLEPIRFKRASRPRRPSPLKAEIQHLRDRIAVAEDALSRAVQRQAGRILCCPTCSIPGYSALCDEIDVREKRIKQLEQRLAFHSRIINKEPTDGRPEIH